ncbi:MAG: type IV pilus assembly protein PilM [Candidatus Cloacimonadota bacterium]|nr:type IV pilus assembly protein PilM [Candidatus Cloacimonadota bacterium]
MAKKKKTKQFKESFGLDIGSHSIKLVHLKKIHQGFKLQNFEILSTVPKNVDYSPSDLSPDRNAPILIKMLRSLKINSKKMKHVISSIGGEHTSIKQIKTIFLPEEDLESALFFEAKKHLPISSADMLLDYQVLSVEEKTNNMNILLAASTKELLQSHSKILNDAGISPGIVDVEALADSNCFAKNSFIEDGVYIILDIGAHKTNLIIYGPQTKFFTRNIPWAGYNFTKDIMSRHKMSFEEAEKRKLKYGLQESTQKDSKAELISLDVSEKTTEEHIAQEVKRSLRYYVKEAGNSDFRKIVLMGGSAKLTGLPEYIENQLNISTEVFNPCLNLEMPEKFKDKHDPQLSLAMGLAMRSE